MSMLRGLLLIPYSFVLWNFYCNIVMLYGSMEVYNTTYSMFSCGWPQACTGRLIMISTCTKEVVPLYILNILRVYFLEFP